MNWQQALLLTTLSAPAVGGLAAMRVGARAAVSGAVGALIGSLVLTVAAASGGAVELVSESAAGVARFGISADRMACVLFLLVCGVLAIVQSFAGRYLLGDPRAGRFFALCGTTASMTLVAGSAATMTLMATAWCAAGVLLCLMLIHRNELGEARGGARRTALTFAIGDGAFLLATALVLLTGPDLDLRNADTLASGFSDRTIPIAGGQLAVAPLVAILLATCAFARSAQMPMHKWLPSTLAAPTPVSAMLHAGLVNGAGLLLITFAPLIVLAPAVTWLLLTVGIATAIFSTLMSLVRSDVKGSLAWSTSGQMGFMVAQCATGGFAAALFHMIGHGLYKATLFLGSGGAVASKVRQGRVVDAGPAIGSGPRAAIAVIGSGAALAGALALIAPSLIEYRGLPVLLAFAWITAAQATWSWLSHAGSLTLRSLAPTGAGLLAAAAAYVAAISAFEGFLSASMPPGDAWPSVWIVIAAFALAIAAFTALRLLSPRSEAVANLERRAWIAVNDLANPLVTDPAKARRSAGRPASSLQTASIGATR